eukprot:gnl/MRDRNA2_/MRDRNA2_29399_c0_seq1.p1 gnl/MRDRNA2_/MRDRNA2_29399_c0~~gnl/MRDRNA2_/MRDRNA2_29399_c0_seq1.p1  ORF type:complete len:664 (+),score=247.74 gnl/MRDRNA2_/MRDRNA2_29399_c0_seq1:72-2063(+)
MKTALIIIFALAAPIAAVTPIQKVVQMLGDMAKKGKEEKNIEEVEFAKFKTWCEDVISDKTKSIAEAADKIEQLNADILKAESDAKVLGEEIAAHTADVASWEGEAENATAIRNKEKADYDAAHADYSESIDAIERAIAVLKQRAADIPQSLLQLSKSDLIPAKARAIVASMMQVQESAKNTDTLAAPEANAYEFQSGGVVAMLEKLLHKFEDELFALEKAEMNANANYEMLMQKLTALLRDAKDAIAKKTAEKASKLEFAAESKGEMEVTSATKAEDEKILDDTKAECHAKSDEYEKNQNTRADEVKAIEMATEILLSPAVSGNAAKHLPSLAQVSLIQVRELGSGSGREAAAAFLQRQAKSLGSRYLALAAARMAADPFKKVKKMIKDLIVKLMEEANAEAEHKGFCDTELATNKQTRDNLSADVDELTANIEEKTALISQLTTAIKELSDAIAEIKKQQAEATALRAEEKEKNLATIADAQAGTTAVEAAIKVLKDFYTKAAEASLLQGGAGIEAAMRSAQANGAPYKGQQDESTGVLGMLEVILSDFTRLESETSTAEDAAQAEYDRFMAEANQDAEVKQAEVDHKTLAKQNAEEALADLKKDLERTNEELTAALDYYEKLKPDCVDMNLSYEDRVARRKEEIVSLQEALKILTGEELA